MIITCKGSLPRVTRWKQNGNYKILHQLMLNITVSVVLHKCFNTTGAGITRQRLIQIIDVNIFVMSRRFFASD